MTRIGVLGGTFNPVHAAHLQAAEEVAAALGLARVLLVPSAQPPHKMGDDADPVAPAARRLAWVEAACADRPLLEACDLEVARGGPSYTVDTLALLAERAAPDRPVFILGADAFRDLGSWREPERLFALADFAVMTRPGTPGTLADWIPESLRGAFELEPGGAAARHRASGGRVERVAVTALDVSSSELRARVRRGEPLDDRVPEPVRRDIEARGVYSVGGGRGAKERMTTDAEQLARAHWVAEAALDRKAGQLVALDVRELASYADTFVLATGTSDRHARSIADAIREASSARGEKPVGVEGYEEGRWVLIDLGDVIVHVFQAEVRELYDLERLWSDAPPLDLSALAPAANA